MHLRAVAEHTHELPFEEREGVLVDLVTVRVAAQHVRDERACGIHEFAEPVFRDRRVAQASDFIDVDDAILSFHGYSLS